MSISIRVATCADLRPIVELLADDPLGKSREVLEDELPLEYIKAFECIQADPSHDVVVAELQGAIVGTLQLSFLPNLTYRGGWRAQIEGVRVGREWRSAGVGQELIAWAIEKARERGCVLLQLTTDKERERASQFYEKLGFLPSHTGMKLHLR